VVLMHLKQSNGIIGGLLAASAVVPHAPTASGIVFGGFQAA